MQPEEVVTGLETARSQTAAWAPGAAAHFPAAPVQAHEPAVPEALPVWARAGVVVSVAAVDAGDKRCPMIAWSSIIRGYTGRAATITFQMEATCANNQWH